MGSAESRAFGPKTIVLEKTTPQSGMSLLENPSFNPHESTRQNKQTHYIHKIN
jgi:hypothetical protein